jgi:methylmalonyl-CoA/ethylmalonyl-CoA epimerase
VKLGRLNHIGVATPDLDASIAFYRDVMGATQITEPFVLESQQVRVCFVNTPAHSTGSGLSENGGTQIELLQPTAADSAVGKWLEKNPLGGQHHICYEVPDIHEAKKWFESLGKRVLGEPRIGAHGTLIFFVHPRDMGGQLTEIMETPKEAH